jgi:hypothetical protein
LLNHYHLMVYRKLTNSDNCMTVTTILDRTKSVRILIFSAAVIAVNLLVNLLLPSKVEGIFNAVFGLSIAVVAFSVYCCHLYRFAKAEIHFYPYHTHYRVKHGSLGAGRCVIPGVGKHGG